MRHADGERRVSVRSVTSIVRPGADRWALSGATSRRCRPPGGVGHNAAITGWVRRPGAPSLNGMSADHPREADCAARGRARAPEDCSHSATRESESLLASPAAASTIPHAPLRRAPTMRLSAAARSDRSRWTRSTRGERPRAGDSSRSHTTRPCAPPADRVCVAGGAVGLTPEDRSGPCESFSRPGSWARKERSREATEEHAGAGHP